MTPHKHVDAKHKGIDSYANRMEYIFQSENNFNVLGELQLVVFVNDLHLLKLFIFVKEAHVVGLLLLSTM